MNAESNTPSLMEMKAALKGRFATVTDDKFTQVKSAELKDPGNILGWGVEGYSVMGDRESAKALNALGGTQNFLLLEIDYRRKDDTDAVFFTFTFEGVDSEFIGMENFGVFLILDDADRIELSEISSHNFDTNIDVLDKIHYLEKVQITVPIADMMAIANAEKIEYRFQFTKLRIEGTFKERDLVSFKGFYNNVFDEDFEVERLYRLTQSPEVREAVERIEKAQAGGCYIATMAYGDYDHPSVIVLRRFRDDRLMQSAIGRAFVSLYYKVSPHLVSWFQDKPKSNTFIRSVLDRIVSTLTRSK